MMRLLFVLLVIVASCDRARDLEGTDPAPVLVLADSVVLREPPSAPLGTPGDFLPLSKGGYLLADEQNFRLLEYDAQGNSVRSIGNKGTGPGEFKSLGPIALDGDSILYVLEPSLLSVLDYRSGEFRRKTPLPAPFGVSLAAKNGAVYFRTLDSLRLPHLSVWQSDAIRHGPRLPASSDLAAVKASSGAANGPLLNTTHSGAVIVALKGDTLAALSQSSENILVLTLGRVLDEVPVARTQRQGVRADLIAQIVSDPGIAERDPQALYTPSIPTAIARSETGTFYTVKADYRFLQPRFTAKLYLSVTDPRTRRTCPDALVPGPEDPRPRIAFRGDTLLVLSQEIQGTNAVTMIRKYIVKTSSCKWIAAESGNGD